VPVFTK